MWEAFSVDRLTCIRPNEDENQSRRHVIDRTVVKFKEKRRR